MMFPKKPAPVEYEFKPRTLKQQLEEVFKREQNLSATIFPAHLGSLLREAEKRGAEKANAEKANAEKANNGLSLDVLTAERDSWKEAAIRLEKELAEVGKRAAEAEMKAAKLQEEMNAIQEKGRDYVWRSRALKAERELESIETVGRLLRRLRSTASNKGR